MKLDLFSECADGHYNKSSGCQQCGHCAERAVCDKNTGYCPSCEPGWIFPLCQQRKSFYLSLFCFYSSPLHHPHHPADTPISTTSRLAANIDSLSELSATCMMCRASPAPVHAGTTYPFLCQRNPLPDLSHPTFKLFFFCYVFPSHAASFPRRKLLIIV